jgi:hypothetical protein
LKNYGHLSGHPGRKIGAEKGKKAVCFIFLPLSFCQALFRKQPTWLKPRIAAVALRRLIFSTITPKMKRNGPF